MPCMAKITLTTAQTHEVDASPVVSPRNELKGVRWFEGHLGRGRRECLNLTGVAVASNDEVSGALLSKQRVYIHPQSGLNDDVPRFVQRALKMVVVNLQRALTSRLRACYGGRAGWPEPPMTSRKGDVNLPFMYRSNALPC